MPKHQRRGGILLRGSLAMPARTRRKNTRPESSKLRIAMSSIPAGRSTQQNEEMAQTSSFCLYGRDETAFADHRQPWHALFSAEDDGWGMSVPAHWRRIGRRLLGSTFLARGRPELSWLTLHSPPDQNARHQILQLMRMCRTYSKAWSSMNTAAPNGLIGLVETS